MVRFVLRRTNPSERVSLSNFRWHRTYLRQPPKPRMLNILIVDDEAAIRESLQGVLEDEGHSASAVESGEACVDAVRSKSFDVILLDIWLPGMEGLESL